MDKIDEIKEKIKLLPITYVPHNHWENTKYLPYVLKMIDLEKVLNIIEEIEKT